MPKWLDNLSAFSRLAPEEIAEILGINNYRGGKKHNSIIFNNLVHGSGNNTHASNTNDGEIKRKMNMHVFRRKGRTFRNK